MNYKRYKNIKNTIIAGASSGIVAGLFLVGGINTVYAESVNRIIPVYSQKKNLDNKDWGQSYKHSTKRHFTKGWRKNVL
jgi:hypothetical protein